MAVPSHTLISRQKGPGMEFSKLQVRPRTGAVTGLLGRDEATMLLGVIDPD